MKKLLIILLAASLALGCKGKKSSWSQKDKDDFMGSCVSGAKDRMDSTKAASYCNCMMGKVEVKYPKASDAGNIDVNTITEMAKGCLK